MATSEEYITFVMEQLQDIDDVTCRKMFGEYMVYIHEKPVLLVCDNTVMVKKIPELLPLLQDAPEGVPYEGGGPHYILDIEDPALVHKVLAVAEKFTPRRRIRRQHT